MHSGECVKAKKEEKAFEKSEINLNFVNQNHG